ncbi:MAG: FtsW/RodA/SpoVE family cell cycle protein, partial [Bacteroidetes bacterium]|nr:FtsW/RodA/SpoVE family cell cycle protein [Bacteroidota bacterium]
FLNMAVVIGILPTKGLNLPFISYGGSSLLANLMVIGLFLSNVFRNDENTNSKI